MANQEHLAVLQKGTTHWNKWREQYLDSSPDLSNADLNDADLSGINLNDANLNGANLRGINLIEADLIDAQLINADLVDAQLIGANLMDANLSGVNLSKADLSYARLIRTRLSNANLNLADLSHADLYAADLNNANFSLATFSNTRLGDLDLRVAKGMKSIQHQGPSTLGIDTIYRSEGQIPEEFLRGAGVPDHFIEYARSLIQHPIQYYTCFISFSVTDQPFVERLYTDLQANGVRCWYFPEDMKIGDKIYEKIDESIRLYDKLVLVLSETSLASEWVEREVDIALAKEKDSKHRVLFPLRLDDCVMTAERYWARSLRDNRHIGNFSQWKNFDFYQAAFQRVLHDLQA